MWGDHELHCDVHSFFQLALKEVLSTVVKPTHDQNFSITQKPSGAAIQKYFRRTSATPADQRCTLGAGDILCWRGYGHRASCEQLRLVQVPVRDSGSSSHWMDLEGLNIIQSRRNENTDWEHSGILWRTFFCVCVCSFSQHQRFAFIGTPAKVSESVLCP